MNTAVRFSLSIVVSRASETALSLRGDFTILIFVIRHEWGIYATARDAYLALVLPSSQPCPVYICSKNSQTEHGWALDRNHGENLEFRKSILLLIFLVKKIYMKCNENTIWINELTFINDFSFFVTNLCKKQLDYHFREHVGKWVLMFGNLSPAALEHKLID